MCRVCDLVVRWRSEVARSETRAGEGIEPALSAWEVCGAARVLPAESVTCGDHDGLSVSDRDYPRVLLPSGMLQRYIARELYPLIIDALRTATIVGLT